MNDVMICRTCLSTTADGAYTKRCWEGPHDLVEAVVTECPHARRDKNGTIRHQNRVKANRACEAENHHPLLCQHVSKPYVGAP